MKFNYKIKQLNSGFDDNAIFLRNVYLKRGILFDCGRLNSLDNSELLDISNVFISHTHMDHFGGFDRFLRGCLNSGNTVRFFGPAGIIENVEGKLRSYNWNLVTDYDFTIEVVELTPATRLGASFSTRDTFKKKIFDINSMDIIEIGEGFTLDYEFFDHGIASVGYRLNEPKNISIIKQNLDKLGLVPGRWLKELKARLTAGEGGEIEADTVNGIQRFHIEYLKANLVEYKQPQDVTYITDIAPSSDNIEKAIKFAKNSNLLIIEAVFMEKDAAHSVEKNHLTINLSKKIFLDSGSDFVRFLHFASRYDRFREEFFAELRVGVENKFFSC